jgi:hypothetical protein
LSKTPHPDSAFEATITAGSPFYLDADAGCHFGGRNAATSDTTPPSLKEFSFTPTTIDTTLSSQTVTVTARVTDDLSGFSSVQQFRAEFFNVFNHPDFGLPRQRSGRRRAHPHYVDGDEALLPDTESVREHRSRHT